MTNQTVIKTTIYYDTQDHQNLGWAWQHNGASGPVDGDLGEDASLEEVLNFACGSDVPLSLSNPSLWNPIPKANGWETRPGSPTVMCESGRATGVRCEWTGNATETEVVEWMPEHLRETHLAAGNSGVYPNNGAVRLVCCSVCAEMLSEDCPHSNLQN